MYFSTNRKNVFYWIGFSHQSCGIQMGCFISCIKMDAYAYEHCPKRKMILSPYFQILQTVVVKDTVINTLTCRPFTIYLPVDFGIPCDAGMEAEVTVILYVDGAPIVSGGTCFCMGAGIYASAFERAAVFVCILYRIVSPWAHFMPGRAEGMPCFVKGNACGGIWG